MTRHISISLSMRSDWQVGTGTTAAGQADSRTARDPQGLPFVPATTLLGLLRDAAEAAAAGLDGAHPGAFTAWVGYLFGDQPTLSEAPPDAPPAPAHLAGSDLRLEEFVRGQLAAHPRRAALVRELTFLRPAVRIDPRSGTALDDHLRFDERARTGLKLVGHLELAGPDLEAGQRQALWVLLSAASRLVDRLGADRRRGAGRCVASLDFPAGWAPAQLPTAQQVADLPGPPQAFAGPDQPATTPAGGPRPGSPPGSAGRWQHTHFRITLAQPLLAPAAVSGNVVAALDHIPGRVLLAHVARCLRRQGVDVSALLQADALRVSPARLEIHGQPALPAPLCLARRKHDAASPLYNALMPWDPDQFPQQPAYLKGGSYLAPTDGDGQVVLARPDLTSTTHAVVDDATQRPGLEGVYTYQALAPGQQLAFTVSHRPDPLPADWAEAVTGPARLATSRKDQGGATIQEVAGHPPARPDMAEQVGQFTVWLLSDAVVCGPALQPQSTAAGLLAALAAGLADPGRHPPRLELATVGDGQDPIPAVYLRSRRVDSWHGRWALPRPSLSVLAAGSALRVRIAEDQPIPADRLAGLQDQGIGLRRGEGFGAVAINHPWLAKRVLEVAAPPGDTGPGQQPAAPRPASPLVGRLEGLALARLVGELIQQRLVDGGLIQALGLHPPGPTNAQLGQLRSLAASLPDDPEAARRRISAWVAATRQREDRRHQRGARPAFSPQVLAALTRLMGTGGQPAQVWQWLDPHNDHGLHDDVWEQARPATLARAARDVLLGVCRHLTRLGEEPA